MKIIVSTLTFFLVGVSFAQISKGLSLIDLDLFGNYTKNENLTVNTSSFNYNISPSYGRFVSDKSLLQFGLSIGQGNNETEYTTTTNEDKSFQSGAFIGYSRFMSIVDDLYITVSATAGGGYSRYENKQFFSGVQIMDDESEYMLLNFSVRPGISYFVNDRWMVSASIGQLFYRLENNLDANTDETNLNAGISLSGNTFGISLSYLLGTKKE